MSKELNDILDEVADYYTGKLEAHGCTPGGVDWNGEESQVLRFEQLCRIIPDAGSFSINDLGCGYGALYEYLKPRYVDFDYRGIDVQSVNRLRTRIHAEGGGDFEYRVTKNAVLRFASADSDVAALAEHAEGPTAVALSYGDPVGLAKILSDFAGDHEVFEIKGGILEGEPVSAGEIAKLATLPSLDALRGTIVGLIQAPATKLVRLFSEPGGQIARVMAAKGRGEGAE